MHLFLVIITFISTLVPVNSKPLIIQPQDDDNEFELDIEPSSSTNNVPGIYHPFLETDNSPKDVPFLIAQEVARPTGVDVLTYEHVDYYPNRSTRECIVCDETGKCIRYYRNCPFSGPCSLCKSLRERGPDNCFEIPKDLNLFPGVDPALDRD